MLKLIKKGDKYWLFEDSQIGLFSPSKFTINLELNDIIIVYENGLKSKRYNVSDCEIYDLGELTPFTTLSGDLFMQKLEELNCPCFQKNENIFNISGGAWGDITGNLSNQTDLQTALDSKLNKDTTAGVERAYIINADGSQDTKATSEFKAVVEGYFNGTNFYTDAGFTILITGETSKIYLALDTNFTYRWTGSAYVQIGGGSERKYFETLGNKYMLTSINAFYSSTVENGLVSDNINVGVSTILTTAMGTRWVTPLLITDKICKLKNFKFRASDNLGGFTQLRIIFFIGQSINGQLYRINNQVIHDETITMASSVGVIFFERNTFTNDVTIPKGYDLCYLISRLDGTGTNLYNVKISGYVD